MKSNTRPSREISSARGNAPGKVLSTALVAPTGEQEPQRSAQGREQNAFGEKLADDAQVPGAQGCANGKLARAAHRARQKKIRDVRARNQQQEADRGEKHQQERLDVADDVFLHRNERDADVFVGDREGGGKIARDDVHVGFGLRERNARFQASDGMRAHRDAAIAKRWIVPLANGRVDVAVMAVEGEARRNHAHDGIGCAIEGQRFPDDVRGRAEFATPETAAENHDRRGADLIVIGPECPAKNGIHAEGGKEVRRKSCNRSGVPLGPCR